MRLRLARLELTLSQPRKVHRIGILSAASEVPQFFDALIQQLRELGQVEGKNIVFERRYAAGVISIGSPPSPLNWSKNQWISSWL